MQVYKETQEELTNELSDFKEKYREVADLLHDTQEDLKEARRRGRRSSAIGTSYAGAGRHDVSGMFSSPGPDESEERGEISRGRENKAF